MSIIRVKSGGRGRPLTIDVTKVLQQFEKQLPRAKERLKQLRAETSGFRSDLILGTETKLPKSIIATADVIDALLSNQSITYGTAKELKQNLRTVSQLASKQERVWSRALASSLMKAYEQDIQIASKNASKYTRETYQRMLARVKKLTPSQQQSFFLSKGYQDVKTNKKSYEHTKAWAQSHFEKETGIANQEMTGEEALAYVMEQRQKDGLPTW